jgi:hypothetical protein
MSPELGTETKYRNMIDQFDELYDWRSAVLFQMIDWPHEAQVLQAEGARSWELDHPAKSDGLVGADRQLIHLL